MDNFSTDSSDDEAISYLIATNMLPGLSDEQREIHKGSSLNRKHINRDYNEAMRRLHHDYFSMSPKYSKAQFERRFRMSKNLFSRIFQRLNGKGLFARRKDATGKLGLYPLQRVVAALRMLAYGNAADSLDEYIQISEDSILDSLKQFTKSLIEEFGSDYLRTPTEIDLRRILKINTVRGFPGCIGSIDCQHWEWQNCPIAWAGQYKGKEKKPTVVLEAIADGELWIWHAHFGSPGSLNDINVLDTSDTLKKIYSGEFPPSIMYTINGKTRCNLYYLADGIYPNWALFVKTISEPRNDKDKNFSAAQEALRKDIERAFGVLTCRFQILKYPCRFWYVEDMCNVVKACIVLHNMIVEERRDEYDSQLCAMQHIDYVQSMYNDNNPFTWNSKGATQTSLQEAFCEDTWAEKICSRIESIKSTVGHFSLKYDLIEHIHVLKNN